MKKIIIFLSIIILLIFAGIIFFYLSKKDITGEAIKEYTYSYTKAICNESNYCQDYEIVCGNKGLVDMKSITGAAVQHSEDWQDPRNNSDPLCQ